MKKTYLKPTMMVVPVQITQMLCASVESNVLFEFGDETPPEFTEEYIR